MAALSATIPTNTGTVTAPAAVAASDTIAASLLGSRGAYLKIINGGGSSDTITISDHGNTPSGNPLASNAITGLSVANGTSKIFLLRPDQANPATALITITHSFTTSVTYELWPVGF